MHVWTSLLIDLTKVGNQLVRVLLEFIVPLRMHMKMKDVAYVWIVGETTKVKGMPVFLYQLNDGVSDDAGVNVYSTFVEQRTYNRQVLPNR
ncbi:MAG: hypothetical protein A2201_14100 [Alicyclobacillus sp. RIFOXYA1_FULL_53_8]|nr:MAG: hypothetical protein A2201_14100 [Alicyclobacillus sp. RIFOXYA1_FULL_53_8]